MDSKLLHYQCITSFNKHFYKDLLTKEHLILKETQKPKLRYMDGEVDEEANFWGYEFIKDQKVYLVSIVGDNDETLDVKSMLPIMPMDVERVANPKGEVFYYVKRPVSVKFTEEKKHTPKQFIDTLSGLSHTSEKYQKLLWMQALSQLWDRSYYRVSTPGGFGKDSTVDICNALFRESGTIEGPTVAKLEERSMVLKWLAVNEVVGTTGKAEWEIVERFLLAAGGHKSEITKHSRAFGNVGEIIDISKFAISLFFNDIDHYANPKKVYFDYTTKSAVLDRFPPMRFYGKFTEDFNALNGVNIDAFVSRNMDFYKDLLYSFHYYKTNYIKHLHKFNRGMLMKMSGSRDLTNINKLLNLVDFYSDTQEEFDSWVELINTAMEDYYCMVNNYIPAVKNFCKKFKITIKDVFPDGSKIELDSITHYVYQEGKRDGVWIDDKFRQVYDFIQTLNLKNSTYIDVVKQLRNFNISEETTRKIVDNKSIWETPTLSGETIEDVEKDIL